jgi:serine/threonine protein kinase
MVLWSGVLIFLDDLSIFVVNLQGMGGSIWSSVSALAKDLIRGCLEMDPAKRLTSMQALNHGWFQVAWPAWRHVHCTFTVRMTP